MSRGFFYAQIFFKGIKALITGTDGIVAVVDVVDAVQGCRADSARLSLVSKQTNRKD
jgi:hypothetical protein